MQVTPVTEDYVLSREAYILLYKRKGTSWFSSLIQRPDPCLNSDSSNPSPKSVLQNINTVHSSFASESNVNNETMNAPADTLQPSLRFSCEMGNQDVGANDLENATSANLNIFESVTTKSSPIVTKNLRSNGEDDIDGFHPLSPMRSPSPDNNFQTRGKALF